MTKAKPLPSRESILECLRYDPKTGHFWWLRGGNGRQTERPAGRKTYRNYSGESSNIQISVNRTIYPAHRLAWVVMTGNDPGEMTIDHRNRNPFDNRWSNLRLADASLQARNRRPVGLSQFKGICFDKRLGKWKAYEMLEGNKKKHLGYFATEEEAATAAAPYYIP